MRALVSIGICTSIFFGVLFVLPNASSAAGQLAFISDLISDSRPSSTSTLHTITFTVSTSVPSGGQVTVTPEPRGGGNFTVPPAMDYTDMTFSVSSGGGPFVPRTLTILPSATDDGVTVVTGVTGYVVFNLASGVQGLLAGDVVRITMGQNNFIASPAVQGSYHIRVRSFDGGGIVLDIGSPLIAVVNAVTVTGDIAVLIPLRSNGLPSGLLPGATTVVLVSLNSDIPATCKYATTSGVDYFSMATSTIIPSFNIATLHYFSTPVTQNTIYSYYVRCATLNGSANPDDYLITFEIGVIPSASSTPLPPPPPPTPSGPSGGGGGGGLFLKGGDVTISGSGIPGAALTILKDGKITKEDQISVLGSFTNQFTQLDRGTYTWGVYMKDPDGNLSSTYNSTIYLIGGTNNMIAPGVSLAHHQSSDNDRSRRWLDTPLRLWHCADPSASDHEQARRCLEREDSHCDHYFKR